MHDDEPVEIYQAESSHQAHFLKNVLADAGIAAQIVGENSTLGIRPGEESGPVLCARRREAGMARQVLEDWEQGKRFR